MKILHHFDNLRLAQAFSDYLNNQKIENTVEKNEFGYQINIKNDAQQAQTESELSQFLSDPTHHKYLAASWQSGHINSHLSTLPTANSNLLNNFKRQAGLFTHSVFILCILIYLLMNIGLFQPMDSVLSFFMQQPFDYLQSWRFITPAFLHFSMLHIVFNLLWWWQLGGVVELQQGKQRLAILFIFSAAASNTAQFILVGPYFGGLSGVVYGLVGYCWLYGHLNKKSKVRLPNNLFIFLLGWLGLGFIDLLPVHIANYAHLVGLFTGLIMATVCTKLKRV